MKTAPISTSCFEQRDAGPDSTIDPSEQVAFYDPGLGSPRDNHFTFGWAGRKIYNFISRRHGLWHHRQHRRLLCGAHSPLATRRPGLLIWLQPRRLHRSLLSGSDRKLWHSDKLPNGEPVKLDVASSKKLASYAVKHVYQFTSSRPRHSATHANVSASNP